MVKELSNKASEKLNNCINTFKNEVDEIIKCHFNNDDELGDDKNKLNIMKKEIIEVFMKETNDLFNYCFNNATKENSNTDVSASLYSSEYKKLNDKFNEKSSLLEQSNDHTNEDNFELKNTKTTENLYQKLNQSLIAFERYQENFDKLLNRFDGHISKGNNEIIDNIKALFNQHSSDNDEKLNTMEKKINETKAKVEDSEKLAVENNDFLKSIKNQLKQNDESKENFNKYLKQNMDNVKVLNEQVNQNTETINTINDQLKQNDENLKQRDNSLETIKKQLERNIDSIKTINKQLNKNINSINVINDQLEQNEESKENINKYVKQQDDTVNTIKEQLKQIETGVKEKLNELEKNSKNNYIKIINNKNLYKQHVEESKESFDNIKKDLDQFNKSLNLLKQQLGKYNEEGEEQQKQQQQQIMSKIKDNSIKLNQQEHEFKKMNIELNELLYSYFKEIENKFKKFSNKNKENKENFKNIEKQIDEKNKWLKNKFETLNQYMKEMNELVRFNEIKLNEEIEKSNDMPKIIEQKLDKKFINTMDQKLKIINKVNQRLDELDSNNKEMNNLIQNKFKKMEKCIEEINNFDNLLDKIPSYEGSFSLGDDCFYNGDVFNSSGKGTFKNDKLDFEIEGYFKNNSLNINKPFTFTGKFRNPVKFELTNNKKIDNFKITLDELSKVERIKCEKDSLYLIFPRKETSHYTEDIGEGIILDKSFIYKGELNSSDEMYGEGTLVNSNGEILKKNSSLY